LLTMVEEWLEVMKEERWHGTIYRARSHVERKH
jgi:hypothetical protein